LIDVNETKKKEKEKKTRAHGGLGVPAGRPSAWQVVVARPFRWYPKAMRWEWGGKTLGDNGAHENKREV
jgi:hypothetical protein